MKIYKASKTLPTVRSAKSLAQYFGIFSIRSAAETELTNWLNYEHTVKPVLNEAWIQRNRVFSRIFFYSQESLN
jgi:hypothetical protein